MKKIALITLAALLAISLVACAPEENNNSELDAYVQPVTTHKIATGTLTFEEGVAESAVISDYAGIATAHSVVVPEKMNDREVSGIGKEAFYYCTAMTSIYLPGTVTFIDDYAFAGCTSLETIVIPASVTRIGKLAFQGCTSLKTIVLKGGALEIIDDFAFDGCSSLEVIVIPEGVKTIGNQVFGSCESLKYVKLSSTVKSIGNLVFKGCKKLNTEDCIILTESINDIAEFAFSGIEKKCFVAPEGSYAEKFINAMTEK